MTTASFGSSTYSPDRLIAQRADRLLSRQITLLSGESVVRGEVLGKVTASGKYKASLSAAGDGSETPDLIAAVDADASGGDLVTVAYERGDFNEDALTVGTAHTLASIREGLRGKGISIVGATPASAAP